MTNRINLIRLLSARRVFTDEQLAEFALDSSLFHTARAHHANHANNPHDGDMMTVSRAALAKIGPLPPNPSNATDDLYSPIVALVTRVITLATVAPL